MKFDANQHIVRIGITSAERRIIKTGGIVGDRVSPFNYDAKTEVCALESCYMYEDADQRIAAQQCIGRLLTNEDVILYVPQHFIEDTSTVGVTIPSDRLLNDHDASYLEHCRRLLPYMGYMISFELDQ